MKLSKTTIALFKNFAGINPNLLIKPGNTLFTLSPAKFVYAEAQVEEQFPTEFGIYDLQEFLSIISIFDNPDVDFDTESNSCYISEGKLRVRFNAADPQILVYPKRSNGFPDSDADVRFDMPNSLLMQITKAASVLKAPFVSVVGDGENIVVNVTDTNNVNANSLQISVGETTHTFTVNLKADLFKMLPGNYSFLISGAKKSCKIAHEDDDKFYMLAWELSSSFTL